jgi:serine/threonine-protein kinase RsbW
MVPPPPARPDRSGMKHVQTQALDGVVGKPISLSFPASEADTRQIMVLLTGMLRAEGVGRDALSRIDLVLSEVLNNVVEHAFADTLDGQISLKLRLLPNHLECTVTDSGRALPNGQLPKGRLAPMSDNRADLPEGGFGWYLIRTLAENVQYRRLAGANHLRFVLSLCET